MHYGTGGGAAVPNSYYLPSITGQIIVEIPPRALAATAGGKTVAKIVRNGVTGRTFTGYGGNAGTTKDYLTEPGMGEHSQYAMKGGGAPAPLCELKKQIPAGYGPITVTKPKCKKVNCYLNLEGYTLDKNKWVINNNHDSSGVYKIPKGFESSSVYGTYVPKQMKNGLDGSSEFPYEYKSFSYRANLNNIGSFITYFRNELNLEGYFQTTNGSLTQGNIGTVRNYFPQNNKDDDDFTEFSAYSNKDSIYYDYRCYKDSYLYYEKTCDEEELVETTSYGYHGQTVQPAICRENGGDATSFGAGGGGGSAGDTPGVFSRGGLGGYGAVVVEW